MTNTATTRTLVIEREMPHPPEKIWRALTEGQLIEQWLMKNDFQPIVGHRFSFRATPVPNWNGIIDCEVLVVEPNSRLSYGWGSMGLETVVTWTLTPTAGGTISAWSNPASRRKKAPTTRVRNTAGRSFIGNLENGRWRIEMTMKTKSIVYWTTTILVAFFMERRCRAG